MSKKQHSATIPTHPTGSSLWEAHAQVSRAQGRMREAVAVCVVADTLGESVACDAADALGDAVLALTTAAIRYGYSVAVEEAGAAVERTSDDVSAIVQNAAFKLGGWNG